MENEKWYFNLALSLTFIPQQKIYENMIYSVFCNV